VTRRLATAGTALALLAAGLVAVQLTAQPAAASTTAAAISAGSASSCALQSGKAYCWGDNTYGEAGNNTTSPATQLSPVAVYTGGVLSGVTLTQVHVGDDFACGLSSAGGAYCWGDNNDGQLGNGTTTNSSVPVAVTTSGALSGVTLTAISANRYTVCALSSTGTVYCWGADDFGQLGNGGSNTNSSVPVAVTTSGTPMAGATIVQISTGWEHACALSSAGAVYCWGDNTYGELGNSTTTSSGVPVATATDGVQAAAVSAGEFETCGLTTTGAAYCVGNDQYGQLGNGTTGTSVSTASPVTSSGALSGVTLTQLSVGQGHVCALSATGAAYCWGYDAYGQLGNNSSTSPVNTPVAVYTGGTLSGVSLAQISAGNTYTCAQSASGTSYCWGSGASGELGNNNGSANALAAVLVGPQAPVSVTATAGTGSAAVSWVAPAYLNNGTLTSYTATASPGSGTCTSTSATSCTISGLTGGTLYTITVTTTASTGTSAPGIAATVTPLGSLTATTPASLTWSGIASGLNHSIVDGVAGDQQLSVNDASGSGAGWHITMSATTVTAGSRTLPNASALDVNGSVTSLTGVAPSVACVSSCTLPTNKTSYPVALTTAATSPSAYTIYDTAAATGIGAVTIGGSTATHPLGWWVNVPASAYAGSYTSTITISLISGP
jgi:alpha-tubulin suppressor-like RCC1 family protein